MLTKRQLDLFNFLNEYINEKGLAPSFDEMREAIGLKSKSGVFLLIRGLTDRGFIRTLPHRARAIEILKYPPSYENQFQNLSKNNMVAEQAVGHNPFANKFIDVPVCGKIAAGTPIEAIEHSSGETISVSESMLGTGQFYALKVEGDSMVDAGINDGDRVVIKNAADCKDGDIAVAVVNNEEVTLKYLRKDIKNKKIKLVPANKDYEVRELDDDKVKIRGTLALLIRSYN